MRSTKLDSISIVKRTPKLSRLLKNNTSYEYAVEDHIPYFWAGYRVGAFDNLTPVFKNKLTNEEFADELDDYISTNNLTPFSLFGVVKGVPRIIGIAMFWVRGRVMETSDIIWFPWASKRLILECYINFVNKIRKEEFDKTGKNYMILEYAQEKDAKFFDHVCSYGIMRRVGTSYEIYQDAKCCVYESRSIKNAE